METRFILIRHGETVWNGENRFQGTRDSPLSDRGLEQAQALGRRFADLQVKAIVHQLVLRYRWSVPPGYEMPIQQAPISKPRDGLPLVLEPLAAAG